MAKNQGSQLKGNPASKRMGNQALKARRAASWVRNDAAKKARQRVQAARQRDNDELRALGFPTPWQAAKAARRAARLERFGPPRTA